MKVSTSKTNAGEYTEFTSVFMAVFRIELKILEVMTARYKTNTRHVTCCPRDGGTGRMDLCLFW